MENKNLDLFRKLEKKYKIDFKISFFYRFIKTKKPLVVKKFQRIPFIFLENFNEKSYINANFDIKNSKDNSLEHFILFGYDEVLNGKRRIGNEFPFYNEESYLKVNSDIKDAVLNKQFKNGFEHFLSFGYKEFLEKNRRIGGKYPFILNEAIKENLKKSLNIQAYSKANNILEKEAFTHFIEHIEEIREGKRDIYKNVIFESEENYVFEYDDVFEDMKKGGIVSPFEHFLLYGANEIYRGKRRTKKGYFYIEPTLTNEIENEIENFSKKPLISIIMPVYNVDKKWLDLAINSIKAQWYKEWEICIVDDCSTKKETKEYLENINNPKIKIKFLEKNLNISGASNRALELSSGEYIALMDNDDEITVDALYEVVKAINLKNADFIYSDEDKLEIDGRFSEPHFKPDFAKDMFLSQNYLSHLGVIKKELIEKVNGWTIGLEGAQDYDLYLKVLEHTENIYHISKVLYHWRKIEGSTALEFSEKSYAQKNGLKSLESAIERRGLKAKVINSKYPGTYKVEYEIKNNPLVSIIIPFKDKPELLDMCINSILKKSTYKNYEIIGISNNSEEKEIFELMKKLETDKKVSFYEYNVPFNYSKINNYAVKNYANGEHIILLNNDIEIISPNWIEEMLMFSQQKDIGAVGAKLYYPNNTIQHAGVIIGIGGVAGHSHKYFKKEDNGYFSRLNITQNLLAVTGACLMIKKTLYNKLNGLNEKDLKIAFNDVDFCLRLQEQGYQNIYTPYAEAYHYESISRGAENDTKKIERFNSEVDYMLKRHKKILEEGDPFYNKNLTLEHENFEIVINTLNHKGKEV